MTNQDVAISLARAGFAVFPCDQNKRPLISAWRANSTTDLHAIHRLWMERRGALVGLDCGKSGLLIVDCDRREGKPDGVKQFSNLCVEHNQSLTDLFTVSTMNGGLHVYFRQNGELFGNSVGKLCPSVDTRGVGGYAIAPGTQTAHNIYYKANKPITDIDVVPLPLWLASILRSTKAKTSKAISTINNNISSIGNEREQAYAHATLHRIALELSAALPGSRNEALNRAAFRLGTMCARNWIDRNKVTLTLATAAKESGLLEDEIYKTINSGLSAGERSPCNDLPARAG